MATSKDIKEGKFVRFSIGRDKSKRYYGLVRKTLFPVDGERPHFWIDPIVGNGMEAPEPSQYGDQDIKITDVSKFSTTTLEDFIENCEFTDTLSKGSK